MLAALSLLALAAGALAIRADTRGDARQYRVLKPLATAAILGIALVGDSLAPATYRWLVVAGLAFSLAGDVWLMLPSDRFTAGLASFLVGHLLYIAAFASTAGFQLSLAALLPFAIAGGGVYGALLPRLGDMRLPVAVYVVAIGVMGWQATGQWLSVRESWALLALAGALLFTLSDAVLAWNRFRAPVPGAQALVLGTYWPAQWLIAVSVQRGGA